MKDDDEPTAGAAARGGRRRPRAAARGLDMPVTGMEAEFNVVLDGVEIDPRAYWGDPTAFIDAPLLRRERSSLQLPTGGAVYFDRGVIEVVTPVIELAPGCTARVVRNLWEQIALRARRAHQVGAARPATTSGSRPTAPTTTSRSSSRAREQNEHRNIQKLALLLAYILPIPVALVGTNRRSTGLGVRPRGQPHRGHGRLHARPRPHDRHRHPGRRHRARRDAWPSYELVGARRAPIPAVAGVVPGKHTTRKGWLTKDFHYPQSPFTARRRRAASGGRATGSADVAARRSRARSPGTSVISIRRYSDPVQLPPPVRDPERPRAVHARAARPARRLRRRRPALPWGMVLPALRAGPRTALPRMALAVAARAARRVPRRARQGAHGLLGPADAHRAARASRTAGSRATRRRRRPPADGKSDPRRAAGRGVGARPPRPGAASSGNGRGRVAETPRPRRAGARTTRWPPTVAIAARPAPGPRARAPASASGACAGCPCRSRTAASPGPPTSRSS